MARIVSSWKTFTGRRLSLLFPGTQGSSLARSKVWHREYWDRFIRDEAHFEDTKGYIHENPVKAGLVRAPEEWEWSSARLELGGSG